MKQYHIEKVGFAGSAEELIHYLHKGSRARAPSDQDVMVQAAQRLELATGQKVRTGDPEDFVDDLVELDLVHALVEQ